MSALHQSGDVRYYFGPLRRLANTRDDLEKFFTPWPWCAYRDTPHDSHVTNEGNTTCAGVEGFLAPAPPERVTEICTYWQKIYENNLASSVSSSLHAQEAHRELSKYCPDELLPPAPPGPTEARDVWRVLPQEFMGAGPTLSECVGAIVSELERLRSEQGNSRA